MSDCIIKAFGGCACKGCCKPHHKKGYCRSHYWRLWRHGDPLAGRTPPGDLLRFIHEVAMAHTGDECLTWPFGKGLDGYGRVKVDGKSHLASRYVCELVRGAPPTPDHEAAHSCGKGHEACIAPEHLWWKTHTENQADKIAHGTNTGARGERHGHAKLTEAEVREIRSMKGSASQSKLAEKFIVSRTTIRNIHNGRKWAWLSEEVTQ